jgi:hypothetical protein
MSIQIAYDLWTRCIHQVCRNLYFTSQAFINMKKERHEPQQISEYSYMQNHTYKSVGSY